MKTKNEILTVKKMPFKIVIHPSWANEENISIGFQTKKEAKEFMKQIWDFMNECS